MDKRNYKLIAYFCHNYTESKEKIYYMTNIVMNTELQKIEKEIITLKNQTAENMILMGQKFIEAKKLVPHGEWGNWLENKVGFSQRTANQFMRIAKEYISNSQSISNLEATKIYLLLELPVEEREDFVNQNDLQSMSTRDVKKKLKEHKRNNKIWKIVDKQLDVNTYDIPIKDLKPFPDHENYFWDMKGKNYISFLQSIETSGVICPILITRDNMIISGHQRVRACRDLGIDTISATYMYCPNIRNRSLNDILLEEFIHSNMHTRSSVFYLACAWEQLYFGDKDKAKYYMDKFVSEGEQMDKEMEEWCKQKRIEIEELRREENKAVGENI